MKQYIKIILFLSTTLLIYPQVIKADDFFVDWGTRTDGGQYLINTDKTDGSIWLMNDNYSNCTVGNFIIPDAIGDPTYYFPKCYVWSNNQNQYLVWLPTGQTPDCDSKNSAEMVNLYCDVNSGKYGSTLNTIPITMPTLPSLTDACSTLTTDTTCLTESVSCEWDLPTSTCVPRSYTPPATSTYVIPYETCNDVPVAGWFTLPSTFDVPCQLSNFFTYTVSDDPNDVNKLLSEISNETLTIWPIGYITRIITIFNTTTQIEPPAISYSVGNAIASTGISGTYTIQPFDALTNISTITADTNGKGVWEVFMPFWNFCVYLSLIIVVITHLLNAHLGHTLDKNKHETDKKRQNKHKE